jgi:hypothetical protein
VQAWIAKAAKQPMTLESVDPAPLGAEDVEVAVAVVVASHYARRESNPEPTD